MLMSFFSRHPVKSIFRGGFSLAVGLRLHPFSTANRENFTSMTRKISHFDFV